MGMIHDFCGPNTTSVLGSMLVFLGYFLMYLTSNGSIVVPPVVLGMFFFLVGQVGCVHVSSLLSFSFFLPLSLMSLYSFGSKTYFCLYIWSSDTFFSPASFVVRQQATERLDNDERFVAVFFFT